MHGQNVGVAVEIAAPSLAVQKLFQFPVSVAAILTFGSLLTSGNVDSVISKSGRAENVEVKVGKREIRLFGLTSVSTTCGYKKPSCCWDGRLMAPNQYSWR